MDQDDKEKIYKLLEVKLERLLSMSASHLGAASKCQADEFIEHREYGLALEEIAHGMSEAGERVSVDLVKAVKELAQMMEMDTLPLTENLRTV